MTKALFLLLLFPPVLRAQNAVMPGTLVIEPPTLINLGFEWQIEGDDNRNATVEVAYRIAGTNEWIDALPLLRIGGERVSRETEHLDYTVPHLFAGSIFDLDPDNEYECRFTMTDPDGVRGEAVRSVKVRTRSEPHEAAGGRVLHVYPATWMDDKEEPAFTGLKAAYYGSGLGDWSVVSEREVLPGDIILVHAGLYKADRYDYVDPHGIPFDGTYTLTAKGTADRPIVIKAAGDGEVIFDGAGAHRLFDVTATEHHIFDGLTIRNTDIALAAGFKHGYGAGDLTVRNCRFEEVGSAVWTEFAGSRNFYIADNVILGTKDRHRLLGWANPGIYGANPLTSYTAVKVYGSGHVIAHNAIAYFHDAIAISTYGTPEEEQELKAVSIDIYNNDMHLMADDFIEADGGVHNIRVMRNRGVNSAHTALSAQPVFGGPAYFIRNVIYHTRTALKFMAKPAGLYVLHNTIIAENRNTQTYSNAHFRNNLFLGTDDPRAPIMVFADATAYSTYDHNGYRPNRGIDEGRVEGSVGGSDPYLWISPSGGRLRDYALTGADARRFTSLESLTRASGLEAHGVEVDYDVFVNLHPPDPAHPHSIYHAMDLDFRLNAGGMAVDAGTRLPNINDDFGGRAPDLGAIEAGDPVPIYGPRGRTSDHEFYR